MQVYAAYYTFCVRRNVYNSDLLYRRALSEVTYTRFTTQIDTKQNNNCREPHGCSRDNKPNTLYNATASDPVASAAATHPGVIILYYTAHEYKAPADSLDNYREPLSPL